MAGLRRPAVLVFDVNETLLDIEALEPDFARLFGRPGVLREWFGQLITYSMAVTLSNCYADFFTLAQATLRMLAEVHRVRVSDDDVANLARDLALMPAHSDVGQGLSQLRDDGYRLVALTNSPNPSGRPTPLANAGLAGHFERQFSVDELKVFKPATALYRHTADELGVPPSACMMVAAHVWDTFGAQAAGFGGALITRPGTAPLRVEGIHRPDFIAPDLVDLARQLTEAFEK